MESIEFKNRKVFIHKNDISQDINYGEIVGIDTETTGLSILRDRICLIQICTENKECHIVKFDQINKNDDTALNIKKFLNDRQNYSKTSSNAIKMYMRDKATPVSRKIWFRNFISS